MIIGIFGQKEHGKSTFAKMLQQELNHLFYQDAIELQSEWEIKFRIGGFATRLKEIICDTFGITMKELLAYKNSQHFPDGWQENTRHAMQMIGECFRQIKPTVWIDNILIRYKNDNLIVDDGRYLNEAEAIKQSNGYCIYIFRPEKENTDPHPSESEMGQVIRSLRATIAPHNAFFQRYFNEWVGNIKNLTFLQTLASHHARLIYNLMVCKS